MERVNRIVNSSIYKESYQLIQDCEKERIYCRHNMAHFLDVARLAWIFNLEEHFGISKEIVYAAAMLHDIGKHEQYLHNIPHETASAQIASDILKDCGFYEPEIKLIISAIESHRNPQLVGGCSLYQILYRADKMSRSCFTCDSKATCNWDSKKMNLEIKY